MKSIAFYFSAFCLSGILFAACDTIDNPYPVREPKPTLGAIQALDSAEAAHDSINGPVTVVQKVLLEDYTGHQCGNCPSAAMKAREQKAIYNDRLVVMAVHAGFFAKTLSSDTVINPTKKFIYNFSTPITEEWNTSFGVAAYPAGMINRAPRTGSTSRVQGIGTWPAAIAAQIAETPQIGMTITTLYKPETRKVDIKVRSQYLTALTGKYNLIVAITEDGIVNWQKNYLPTSGGDPAYPVGDVQNYVHPHALRQVITGTWGVLSKENPAAGTVENAYFSATLDNSWKKEKISVVAYIFDDATREVVQVEEIHL